LAATTAKLQSAAHDLDHAANHEHAGDPYHHAKAVRETVIPKMEALRALGDALETMVADDLWPLPTYREMLFIK
ncbi:MAG: glutamine synthetase type III, partial [Gemmataceae bacterium]|nr:glutamine synthetase type III [Gemmataceae bacterium]